MGRSATFHASAKNGLFCSYLHGSTATFELEHFWVRPADMSSGVGRALFEDASRMAREDEEIRERQRRSYDDRLEELEDELGV